MSTLDLTQFEGHDGPCTCEPWPSVAHCERCLRQLDLRNASPELLAEVKRLRAEFAALTVERDRYRAAVKRIQALPESDHYRMQVEKAAREALAGGAP